MTSVRERAVMQALARLLARGSIERDVGYTRAQLIAAFGEAPGLEPALAFRTLRRLALAEATVAGGHTLVTVGAGRSTRYLVTRRGPAGAGALGRVRIVEGENLDVLCRLADASFRLIYIDPPFNTGREQVRTRLRTERVVSGGDRTGYGGARYRTTVLGQHSYEDSFSDYCGYLEPRLVEARRVLAADGSLFVHLDYREVHYVKILLDRLFGRASFINELIWAYDYGGRSRSRWSPKHDNILWYAKDPRRYVFNYERMERIPYMAPELVGPEKAARGKTPTDVWWHTIVSPNGREKTGYPTQKPVGVLRRFVEVHSDPGDHVLDFFAGSGSFGEASAALGRHATLVDKHPEAIAVMRRRLAAYLAGEGEDMSLGTGLPGASAASSATADGVAEGSKADAGRARAGASIDPAAPPETAAEEASGAWEMHASGVAEASGERVDGASAETAAEEASGASAETRTSGVAASTEASGERVDGASAVVSALAEAHPSGAVAESAEASAERVDGASAETHASGVDGALAETRTSAAVAASAETNAERVDSASAETHGSAVVSALAEAHASEAVAGSAEASGERFEGASAEAHASEAVAGSAERRASSPVVVTAEASAARGLVDAAAAVECGEGAGADASCLRSRSGVDR